MGEKKGRIEKNKYNFHSVRKNSPKNHSFHILPTS